LRNIPAKRDLSHKLLTKFGDRQLRSLGPTFSTGSGWERYEENERNSLETGIHRETLDQLCRQFYGEEVPRTSVRRFSDDWLAVKQPEVSSSTLAAYKKSISKFLVYLGDAADSDISSIRKAVITGSATIW
jgi:hypothetical protein